MRTIKPSGGDFFDATGVYDSTLLKTQREVNDEAIASARHLPYPGTNGTWMVWNASTGAYVDSGEPSRGADGAAGATGPAGADGDTGATFMPNVDAEGNLSWTNDGGLPNPTVRNIRGPVGATGATGPQGPAGDPAPTSAVAAAVSDWLGEHIDPEDPPVVIDDSLSVTGAAADAKATGDAISYVNRYLSSYIHGVNDIFEVNQTGPLVMKALLLKNVKYTFKNNTSAACTLRYVLSDGTLEDITNMQPDVSTQIVAGQTVTFTPLKDDYVGVRSYFNGVGTATLKNEFANFVVSMNAYPKAVSFVENGELNIRDGLVPNTYIGTNGIEARYNGWSSSDFIPLGDLYKELIIISPSANGGRYDAFYDAEKTLLSSSFALISGVNRITVPLGAKYFRISNTTSAMQNTIVKNIVGNLADAVDNLKPDTGTASIAALNVYESMVTNAGANYGFHSSGQSNVQKRFSMLITTDPHGDTMAMERAVKYLDDMPCFDCGVCIGDLQANTFTDNDGTWYTNIIKTASKNWLTIIGNHDVGLGNNPSTTGNQQQVYDKFIAPNIQYAGVTDTGKCYYYKDLTAYKIRLICLCLYDVDNNDMQDGSYVVPRYTEYVSQDQADWFVATLMSTPTDYHVMVICHNTPAPATKDTSVNFNNRVYGFSPEGTQSGMIAEIVDAWQNGTSISKSYPCTNNNLAAVSVNVDFSTRGSGVFICFCTGHMHVDAIGHITRFPTQNVFTFASTNTGTYQNDWSDLPRADGTKAEDCITALAVDTANRQIYINRIGSSVSRWFTVREPSVISY